MRIPSTLMMAAALLMACEVAELEDEPSAAEVDDEEFDGEASLEGDEELEERACQGSVTYKGKATFYSLGGLGNCSFPGSTLPKYYAALNNAQYGQAAQCGACAKVTGPKGSVTVKIVDRCPECPKGNLDLNQAAFSKIANLSAGKVPISWKFVPCGLSGTKKLQYVFKEGSSKFWSAVQIRNHRHAIKKVEYKRPNGSFKAIPRKDYNFFVEPAGMGNPPYTLRVTDIHGHKVVENNIPLKIGTPYTGKKQFKGCG